MIEEQSKHWYVEQRGMLAAQQFLLELGASFVNLNNPFGLDYLAIVRKEDDSAVVFGIEVKATDREIDGKYPWPIKQVNRLFKMNIPVLLIVFNSKNNITYFNWIKTAVPPDGANQLKVGATKTLDLRTATPEERNRLKQEILSL